MSGGYLTFDCAGAWFAVDSALVVEVAEAVPATRLPFAPPHVVGIAGIGGHLLPLVDLSGYAALGLKAPPPSRGRGWGEGDSARQREHESSSALPGVTPPLPNPSPAGGEGLEASASPRLVVVRAGSGMLALRAARIGGAVSAESVTPTTPAPEPGAAGLPIVGHFTADGRDLRLLDPARIAIGYGMALAALADESLLAGAPPEEARPRAAPTVRLLVVEAGGRGLALEMDDLMMVFAVDDIRPLPNAPAMVRGLTQARRRPVLLVDALEGTDGAHGYAVVFAMPCGPVGLRVDGIRGVVRVAADATEGGARNGIVEYDGRWLDVRSGRGMLSDHLDTIGRLVPIGGVADAVQDLLPRPVRRFLTFTAAGRAYAIAFERVQRVVAFTGRHRLPGEVATFDGITDVDGAILPVLDLRRILGEHPDTDGPRAGVSILVQAGGGTVAILADEIQRIRKVPTDAVDPMADPMISAVIQWEGALIPVLRPEGLMAPRGHA